MGADELQALTVLLGGSAVLVAGLVQALKALVFPEAWQHGRAPMIAAAILAALAVAGAMLQAGLSFTPAAAFAGITAWLTVYTAAVGAHQTVSKAGRVMAGTTDPTGPDDAP